MTVQVYIGALTSLGYEGWGSQIYLTHPNALICDFEDDKYQGKFLHGILAKLLQLSKNLLSGISLIFIDLD